MKAQNLYAIIQQGGAVMWPLFALLLITIIIALERSISYWLIYRRDEQYTQQKLESPLAALDFIAMIAPVLGFLGTVTGMISAFRSVSEATSIQLQVVAGGLYEALYTTAFGLVISIIATVFSFLLDVVVSNICVEEK